MEAWEIDQLREQEERRERLYAPLYLDPPTQEEKKEETTKRGVCIIYEGEEE